MKILLVFFAAILCAGASGLQNAIEDGCSGLGGRRVYIIADNCQHLARCSECGPGVYQNSASVHGKYKDAFAIWTLETVAGNKCALKSDIGNYAARCHGCWNGAAYSESVFVHGREPSTEPYAQWTVERYGDLYAFKSDTGKYMARCNSCVTRGATQNFAFVNSDSPTSIALWQVEVIGRTQNKDGCLGMSGRKVYIISDTGAYLARCHGCGEGIYLNSAGVHGQPGDAFAMWTLESVGNKCALKSDTGYYAARCNGCWKEGAYPDSVFVHARDPKTEIYAQWTLERHGDSFAFKADTQKYMARCSLCVPGGIKPDFAFVHVDSLVDAPYAMWKIEIV